MASEERSRDYFVANAARIEQNLHDDIEPCYEEFLKLKEEFSKAHELGQFSRLFSPKSWAALSSFQKSTRAENDCRLLQKEFSIERTALVGSFDDRALGAETFTTKLLQFSRLAGFHNAVLSITATRQQRLQRKRRTAVQSWKTSDISQAMAQWKKNIQDRLESHEQDDGFQEEKPEDGLEGHTDKLEEEEGRLEEEEDEGGVVQEVGKQDEVPGSPTQKEISSSSANLNTILGSANEPVAGLLRTLDLNVTTSKRRRRVKILESVS